MVKFECSPCADNYIEQGTKCIGENSLPSFYLSVNYI